MCAMTTETSDISCGFVDLDGVRAWRVAPADPPRGGLIVLHEIWGLVAHTRDVANRLAAEGYVVYAPDLLTAAGTTPEIGEELQAIMSGDDEALKLDAQPRLRAAFAPATAPEFAAPTVARLRTVLDALESEEGVNGRIAVTGFCFGGSYAFALASADDRIKAAVPFYGAPPSTNEMSTIHCPVLALYGEDDDFLIDGLPTLRNSMASAGVNFTDKVYPSAGHAFFNDVNPRQYRKDAAEDAWRSTLTFLADHLQ